MPRVDRLAHCLDPATMSCRVVIETPKGSRSKFDYDPKTGLFKLGGLLPEGMSFPFDFGFIPSTRAEDGDPLDVLVLHDEPLPVGVVLAVRLVGVIEGFQTEGSTAVRNDRLLAVSTCSHLYEQIDTADALGSTLTQQLEWFWVNDNAVKGKTFEVLGLYGPQRAVAAVQAASMRNAK